MERITDELFESICKVVDKRVSRQEHRNHSGRGRGRGNGWGRGGASRAQRAMRREVPYEEEELICKFNLDSDAHQ